jgi:glutamine synthetase
MAWMKSKSYLVMGDVIDPHTGDPYIFSPRNILKKQINSMKDMGYKVKAASELEYFLYNKKYNENYQRGLTKLKEVGSHAEDYLLQQGDRLEYIFEKFRTKLKDSGLQIETTKGEASIGQHEINVAFDNTVEMSDSILVLKTVI